MTAEATDTHSLPQVWPNPVDAEPTVKRQRLAQGPPQEPALSEEESRRSFQAAQDIIAAANSMAAETRQQPNLGEPEQERLPKSEHFIGLPGQPQAVQMVPHSSYQMMIPQQQQNGQQQYIPVMAPFMGNENMTYMAVPVNLNVPIALQQQAQSALAGYPGMMMPSSRKRKRKNRLCSHEGCTKNARGRTAFCVRHGGGIRCSVEGCLKGARPHSSFCSSHGGGHRCLFAGCTKGALAKSVYCRRHGKLVQSQRSQPVL